MIKSKMHQFNMYVWKIYNSIKKPTVYVNTSEVSLYIPIGEHSLVIKEHFTLTLDTFKVYGIYVSVEKPNYQTSNQWIYEILSLQSIDRDDIWDHIESMYNEFTNENNNCNTFLITFKVTNMIKLEDDTRLTFGLHSQNYTKLPNYSWQISIKATTHTPTQSYIMKLIDKVIIMGNKEEY